jgi:UDP-3-O-[3-hydroxymyristoyl] glucosamine N-acyltransferase
MERAEVFAHEHGLCESEYVGRGTRVWAFAHVLSRARMGADCNICDGVFIGGAVLGDSVTVKGGLQMGERGAARGRRARGPNAPSSPTCAAP